jgi:hypothetical protein
MKKLLLVFPASILFHVASAQIPKGSLLLGGGVSVATSKTEMENNNESKQSNVAVNLSAGVAVRENTIVGGIVSWGRGVQKNNSNPPFTSYETNGYGVGGFLRQYLPLGNNFYLFGQGVANYGHSESEAAPNIIGTTKTNGWSVGLSLAPGISYAVNRRFHLEASLNDLASVGYGQTKVTRRAPGGWSTNKQSSFGLSTSLGSATPLAIGFRFLFAKQKRTEP